MTETEATFRRLVVALGASRGSLATLALWADLASRLRADFDALFVEDAELERMAGLPFGRVVAPGALARAFDAGTFERLMRSAAASARAAVEAEARQRAIPCSFRTVRGVAADALPANVGRGDLVVVERAAFGAAAWQVVRACRGSVLYLRPEARADGQILVLARDVLDDGAAAGTLLGAATQLAAASARPLVLLLHGDDGESRRRAEDLLARRAPDVATQVRALGADADAARLASVVRGTRGSILVASRATLAEVFADGGLDDDPGCSILAMEP